MDEHRASTRQVLLWTGAVFAAASLPALVHDYDTLIALQFVRRLAVSAFISPHSASSCAAWPAMVDLGHRRLRVPLVLSQNIGSAVGAGIRRPGGGSRSSGRTRRDTADDAHCRSDARTGRSIANCAGPIGRASSMQVSGLG
jgi:hypothetical protein